MIVSFIINVGVVFHFHLLTSLKGLGRKKVENKEEGDTMKSPTKKLMSL
jgi:hypothetical protein